MAKRPNELQQMLEEFHSVSKQIGLKMYKSKTKVIINKLTPTPKIQVEGQKIESVQNHLANFSQLTVILNLKSKE